VATKIHKPENHHCYCLHDLIPLLEQMGFVAGEKYENEKEVCVSSTEKTGSFFAAQIHLDKTTGKMMVTDNTR
jgi:hypothetical protein